MDFDIILEEIENWIFNYLDVANDYYNGNKPCPFAKKAFLNNKVKIIPGTRKDVMSEISNWDDTYELVAVVFEDYEGLEAWSEEVNKKLHKNNLYLMSMEPLEEGDTFGDPVLDAQDWGVLTDEVYGWVFIQRLSHVEKYSKVLEDQGYYKNLDKHFLSYVQQRRKYHARSQEENEEEGSS